MQILKDGIQKVAEVVNAAFFPDPRKGQPEKVGKHFP